MSAHGPQPPPGPFGPALQGGVRRRQGRRWRHVGLAVVAAVAVLAALILGTGVALLWYGERSLNRVEVDGIAEEYGIEELREVRNILVVGNDSREGLTEEQLRRLGTEDHGSRLTDTVMLVQLDPRRTSAAVLSFPRDLLVTRCDGSRGRINAAHHVGEAEGVGGPSCLVQTVSDFTGIPVHHYVEVNFAGFVEVVDTLGGVTMYFPEPIRDRHAGLDLPAGCVELDGVSALSFVRARQIDDDFGRIARQQRFIRELTDEATRVGTLVNVPRLFSLIDALAETVTTDADLSIRDMRRIAYSLRDFGADRLEARTVPGRNRVINGAAYVVAEEEAAETLFQAFRRAEVFPEGIGTEPPRAVAVGDVDPLTVLNGVGVSGLAAEVAAVLEQRGFEIAETDNAEHFDFAATVVRYPTGEAEEGELIAEALGGAQLEELAPGAAPQVVIGEDLDVDALEAAGEQPGAVAGSSERGAGEPEPEPTYQGVLGADEPNVPC